jgi:pyruvate,water dikinase
VTSSGIDPEGIQLEILETTGGGSNLPTRRCCVPVAVRSSATAEDLPTASFAGQQDTYLNVCGEEALLAHVKSCWASLWTTRATSYRTKQGFDHHKVYLAVVIQAMIPSEIAGILFTANPVDGNRDVAVINASWGLGEAIVSGLVTPDTLTVHKSDREILSRLTASKDCCMRYASQGGVVKLDTPAEQRTLPALTDHQALELVNLGCRIEHHYGAPQDIEWAYAQGNWYILQVRPVTTLASQTELSSDEPEYNRSMFVDIFPDPLSPVFSSVVETLFNPCWISLSAPGDSSRPRGCGRSGFSTTSRTSTENTSKMRSARYLHRFVSCWFPRWSILSAITRAAPRLNSRALICT